MSALPQKRASGVLMHIASLPGEAGIGTLGRQAYAFADFLHDASQTYWQLLPLCPTGFGDSPYQSFSTFAGNPYFIDPELLCRQGFLRQEDLKGYSWGECDEYIDYGLLYKNRASLFEKVQYYFSENVPEDFVLFCRKNSSWLEDYALFAAIKDAHGGAPLSQWEEDIRRREPETLTQLSEEHRRRTLYYKMLQYLFYSQWYSLKRYANSRGIQIIGDLPIYVAEDSADVWASPQEFCLDSRGRPTEVAGCPPDAYAPEGQLWGNPVYDWEHMKQNGYSWWKRRLKMSLESYDVIRIDHFRGFDSYYCIEYGAENAVGGIWRKGPGYDFWHSVKESLGEIPVIAEDLGFLSDSVRRLLAQSGFPGMKILQFAFDAGGDSSYLPYKYEKNCVVYTGTHDNNTIIGWIDSASPQSLDFAMKYLRAESPAELRGAMLAAAMSSVADTCILQMQDLLGLGSEARMNIPSTVGCNWRWRAAPDAVTPRLARELARCTELYGRARNH